MIHFKPLATRPADWDERIRQYDTKTLFHESSWLDHVMDIHRGGRIRYFEVVRDGVTIGYHCGLQIRKMMLPIHGSPLGGTGTNYMGPLVAGGTDQRELVRGMAGLLGVGGVLHLELSHYMLDPEIMRAEGFSVQSGVTHLVRLDGTVEDAWAALKSEARNRVRKSQKNGLVVERTDDPAIVDEFFEQFTEVYGKQGMVVPFGRERPRSLFERLLPVGRLLALRVRHGQEVVATGLFPYDERCIYFWGAASWIRHHRLSPNEALQWAVIEFAVREGIPAYNMCGGTSQFKNKFGGEDVPYNTYYRSALPMLSWARDKYRARHYRRLRKNASIA